MSQKIMDLGKLANGKYELQKRLGQGCFGEVYRGVDVENGEEVAVKVEDKSCQPPQLKHEADILDLVKNPNPRGEQPQGFTCPYYFFGPQGPFHVMVIPLLSRSLEDCMVMCKQKFSVKTTIMVADQILKRIEYLHSKGVIHRDIKPENFMWGSADKRNILYIIDFGLSKHWYEHKRHIPFKQNRNLTGTARYASIRAHKGHEQGRRDDLEAIGHMLLYFLRGSLPWSGLDAKTKEEKYLKIQQKKEAFPLDQLCEGFPNAFLTYLQKTRAMDFADRPDYNELRDRFQQEFASAGYEQDYCFDWYKGKKPTNITPEPRWVNPPQPDDGDGTGTGSGGGGGGAKGGGAASKSCCATM